MKRLALLLLIIPVIFCAQTLSSSEKELQQYSKERFQKKLIYQKLFDAMRAHTHLRSYSLNHMHEYYLPLHIKASQIAVIRFKVNKAHYRLDHHPNKLKKWSLAIADESGNRLLTMQHDDFNLTRDGYIYIAFSSRQMNFKISSTWNKISLPINKNFLVIYEEPTEQFTKQDQKIGVIKQSRLEEVPYGELTALDSVPKEPPLYEWASLK